MKDIAKIEFLPGGSVEFSLPKEGAADKYECFAAYVAYRSLLEESNSDFFRGEVDRLHLEEEFTQFLRGDAPPKDRPPVQLTLV